MLGKDLQQVPSLIKINQDVQLLEDGKIFVEVHAIDLQAVVHCNVVRVRYREEGETTSAEIRNSGDDVDCTEGDVLNAGAVVIVDKSALSSLT